MVGRFFMPLLFAMRGADITALTGCVPPGLRPQLDTAAETRPGEA